MARLLDGFSSQLSGTEAALGDPGVVADVCSVSAAFCDGTSAGSLAGAMLSFINAIRASLASDANELAGAVTALKNWGGASSTTIGANLINLMGVISSNVGSVSELASVATAVHAKVGAIPDTGDSAAALAAFVPHCTVS
jgi:hypothetical protein